MEKRGNKEKRNSSGIASNLLQPNADIIRKKSSPPSAADPYSKYS